MNTINSNLLKEAIQFCSHACDTDKEYDKIYSNVIAISTQNNKILVRATNGAKLAWKEYQNEEEIRDFDHYFPIKEIKSLKEIHNIYLQDDGKLNLPFQELEQSEEQKKNNITPYPKASQVIPKIEEYYTKLDICANDFLEILETLKSCNFKAHKVISLSYLEKDILTYKINRKLFLNNCGYEINGNFKYSMSNGENQEFFENFQINFNYLYQSLKAFKETTQYVEICFPKRKLYWKGEKPRFQQPLWLKCGRFNEIIGGITEA